MEIKLTISILCSTKSGSSETINAYKNIHLESTLSELMESVQFLRQGFLALSSRLRCLEAKLRKV